MADVIYKVHCKDCPSSYITESSRPLDIRLKDHCAEADKVTKACNFTHQQRKSSYAEEEEYKSAIAEHAAIDNQYLDVRTGTLLEDERDKGSHCHQEHPSQLQLPPGRKAHPFVCVGLSPVFQPHPGLQQ